MSVFTGVIVRPGAGNLAFQVVKIHIYTGMDTPCITEANKADHLTTGTDQWRIEQAPALTHAVAHSLFPSGIVPLSLVVSKYRVVCCSDPTRSYRIFGLKEKPGYMPARDATMEIAKRTSIATQAYLESNGGSLLRDVTCNRFDNNGWYKPWEMNSILQTLLGRGTISSSTLQSTVSTSITVRSGDSTSTMTSSTSQLPSLPLPSLQIPRVHVTSFLGLPTMPIMSTTPVSAPYAARVATVKPLCPHVAKIIAKDARTSGGECPITFDSFQDITKFCVPVCGHVCSESASQLTRCPVCREATSWSVVDLPVSA